MNARRERIPAVLEELRRNWDEFGRRNPITAINSGLVSSGWSEFFESGEEAIVELLEDLQALGIVPSGRALDFGCGAGRLTQALARRFDNVVGVDVAASMIDLANNFNAFPGRCEYLLNAASDLSQLEDGTFDFVCSLIVIQHMENALAERYLSELVRLLRHGGIAALQIPVQLRDAEPLPPSGAAELEGDHPYRASVRLADELPEPLESGANSGDRSAVTVELGAVLSLSVVVTNLSTSTWAPEHLIRLGTRWRTAPDMAIVEPEDDGTRVLLPGSIEAGASVQVSLHTAVPRSVGSYLIELDLVQEGVTWFSHHRSPPLALGVQVVAEGAGPVEVGPRMEMHGLGRDKVMAAVARAGGTIVATLDDESAGPEWVSYLYVIRRDREAGGAARRGRRGLDLGDELLAEHGRRHESPDRPLTDEGRAILARLVEGDLVDAFLVELGRAESDDPLLGGG